MSAVVLTNYRVSKITKAEHKSRKNSVYFTKLHSYIVMSFQHKVYGKNLHRSLKVPLRTMLYLVSYISLYELLYCNYVYYGAMFHKLESNSGRAINTHMVFGLNLTDYTSRKEIRIPIKNEDNFERTLKKYQLEYILEMAACSK